MNKILVVEWASGENARGSWKLCLNFFDGVLQHWKQPHTKFGKSTRIPFPDNSRILKKWWKINFWLSESCSTWNGWKLNSVSLFSKFRAFAIIFSFHQLWSDQKLRWPQVYLYMVFFSFAFIQISIGAAELQ